MPVRYLKLCLRVIALSITCASALWVISSLRGTESHSSDNNSPPALNVEPNVTNSADDEINMGKLNSLEFRPLQQPLFDPPPPPPKQEVVTPLPPLGIRLLGTVIDPVKPQAIIADQQGNVKFLSLGQAVGIEHPDSAIEEILPSAIKVRRKDQLDTVSVE